MIASNPFVAFRDSFSWHGSGRDWLSRSNLLRDADSKRRRY